MPEFEFVPLVGTPAVTVDAVSQSKTYAVSVRRVFKTATDRCRAANRAPSLREAHLQLAIRTAVLETSTGVKELSAMRDLIRKIRLLQAAYDEAGYIMMPFQLAPKNVELPFWFRFEDWNSFDSFAVSVGQTTYKKLRLFGRSELPTLVKKAVRYGSFQNGGEQDGVIAEILSGRKTKLARRSPKIGWTTISESEFEKILDQLPAGAEQAALDSLREGKRTKSGGIARLLARSIWLTGMRALETFQCRLLTTDPDENLSPQELERILGDPRAAHEGGMLRDADLQIARNDFRHDGRQAIDFRDQDAEDREFVAFDPQCFEIPDFGRNRSARPRSARLGVDAQPAANPAHSSGGHRRPMHAAFGVCISQSRSGKRAKGDAPYIEARLRRYGPPHAPASRSRCAFGPYVAQDNARIWRQACSEEQELRQNALDAESRSRERGSYQKDLVVAHDVETETDAGSGIDS